MNHQSVSIIIPTYNRANQIKTAIESVLNQTFHFFELLIVDDGSTDNTEEIVKLFSQNNSNISYLKTPVNMGACAARNLGIKTARFEIITFLDSDDVWRNNFLESQIKFYELNRINNIDFGLQFCGYILHDIDKTKYMPSSNFNLSSKDKTRYSLFEGNFITTQAIFTSKSVLNHVGGFDENLGAFQDWDLVIRISKHYSISYLKEPLIDVYYSADSITTNYSNRLKALEYLYVKYKSIGIPHELLCKLNLFVVFYKIRFRFQNKLPFNVTLVIKNQPFKIKSYYAAFKFFLIFNSLR